MDSEAREVLLNHSCLTTGNKGTAEPVTIWILAAPVLAGSGVGVYQPRFAILGEAPSPSDDGWISAKVPADYIQLVLCLLVVFNNPKLIRV